MSVILAVEDDPVTRAIYTAALSQIAGVSVVGAGSVEEARLVLKEITPDVLLLDLRLPDGLGLDVLGALRTKEKRPAVMVISAHLEELEPPSTPSQIVQLAKPLSPKKLTALVEEHLVKQGTPTPFSLAEYVQLACLGGYSLSLRCEAPETHGEVCISDGKVWSARLGDRRGFAAFAALLRVPELQISFSAFEQPPGDREIVGGWQELLFEAARLEDEASRNNQLTDEELDFSDVLRSVLPGAPPPPSVVPLSDPQEQLRCAVETGIQAVIRSCYSEAVEAFELALSLDPESHAIKHRLRRLKEMGYS